MWPSRHYNAEGDAMTTSIRLFVSECLHRRVWVWWTRDLAMASPWG